jgi:iron-sulfur cluster repair protein YtfE (RIC family)
MTPSQAREKLLAQHGRLRADLARCCALASGVRHGEPVEALDAVLTQLRFDFVEHNATETAVVRPLLKDSPEWGAVLLDRMLEEHVAEHAAFWELLIGTAAEVATRMDDLAEELDAHMAAEERTFLSPLVLDDRPIARHRKEPRP